MSRLEELIAELCPEGVEYKTLGEIAGVSRGGSFQKRIFVLRASHVFTMGRYIRSTVYLWIRRLPI